MSFDSYFEPPDKFGPDPVGDECPECGAPVDDEVWCEKCGAALDQEEAAAQEREAAEEARSDLHRAMERGLD